MAIESMPGFTLTNEWNNTYSCNNCRVKVGRDECRGHVCEPKNFIPPSRNPWYNEVIRDLIKLHDRKSHDYSEDDNPFSNFEFAAEYAGITVPQVFDALIGVKIARKMQLNQKEPQNEPVLDTEKDMPNYQLIKAAWLLRQAKEGTR